MRSRSILGAALAGAVCLCGTAVTAQTGTPEPGELPPLGDPKAPPDDAPPHLRLIDRQDLQRHAYWLASDEREGRYTSSAGQRATVDYVSEHFRQLGLRPLGDKRGFLQRYPLEKVHIEKTTALSFGTVKVTDGYALLPAGDDDKVTLRGKFAWCGNGTGDDLPGLKGKIPLVVLHGLGGGTGSGNDLQAINRYRAIAKKLHGAGASAVVICLLDDQGAHGNTLNYNGLLPDHPKLEYGGGRRGGEGVQVPLFVLNRVHSVELLVYLGVEFDDEGAPATAPTNDKATGSLKIQVKRDPKAEAHNVVAVLDGTNRKSEAIVFSGHHDHIGRRLDGDSFNGADDNASGTAGLLEIAEAFAKGGERPERSIIFLSVSGEELGLWGSAWFADNPTWPLDKIVADINIDMIGRAGGDENRILMQVTPSHGHEKYSSMVRDAVALGAKFGIEFTSGDTYYHRSDHFNFAQKGIPVVFFCDGEHPDYHQVSDHPDKLGYPAMESIARLAFWTGWNVANDKQKPEELGPQQRW